jgi:uncharacterized RDD family membrane protein YckC
MSRRRPERDPEPSLFDLPLERPVDPVAPASPPGGQAAEPPRSPSLPLEDAPAHEEWERRPPADRAEPAPAPLSARYLAGLADLAVHLALAVTLLFGARLLGVPAGFGDGPALLVFLLIFSFLYTVIPLAFWGQTAGMAWAGVVARTPAGETLTFRQTALRWLGGVLTVALLGLPVLLAIGDNRSLADRLSSSETVPA